MWHQNRIMFTSQVYIHTIYLLYIKNSFSNEWLSHFPFFFNQSHVPSLPIVSWLSVMVGHQNCTQRNRHHHLSHSSSWLPFVGTAAYSWNSSWNSPRVWKAFPPKPRGNRRDSWWSTSPPFFDAGVPTPPHLRALTIPQTWSFAVFETFASAQSTFSCIGWVALLFQWKMFDGYQPTISVLFWTERSPKPTTRIFMETKSMYHEIHFLCKSSPLLRLSVLLIN